MGVTDAVRSVLALQAQEPAALYLALWNRIDNFDPSDLDRALAGGAIVKASLFRFTLHAVGANDVPWARAAMRSRARDAGYYGILEDAGLTAERFDELVERLSTLLAEPHDNTAIEQVLSELVPESGDPARLWSAPRSSARFGTLRRPAPGRSAIARPSCPARLQPMMNQPRSQSLCVATSWRSGRRRSPTCRSSRSSSGRSCVRSLSRCPTSLPSPGRTDRSSSM
ncbi:MAG: crosslink repair DNA glycosylase YcaQ family protein [Ilumatobacteraceae bacterium]